MSKPVAWIDKSGHPHHLRYIQGAAEGRLYGPLQPLYDQAAIDAAVAAERERCAAVCDTIARQYKGESHGHAAERAANAIRQAKPAT